jgi:hypothetical protein
VGYVPIHPRDVAGKLPINREHGFFEVSGRHDHSVAWIKSDPGPGAKPLGEAPKAFRTANVPALARAANPNVEAHHLANTAPARLAFDHRSQSFSLDKHAGSLERAAINSRMGTLQARNGSVDAHGNYSTHSSGGSNGGGGSHSGSAGSSSGGGGSHGGGGSSGGGGGFSGGGGGGGGGHR